MPTISDLWYGNIHEMESCGSSPRLLRGEARLEHKRQALRQALSNEQQKLFDEFMEMMYETNSDYAAAAFERGFCLAARLMAEAWTCQIP